MSKEIFYTFSTPTGSFFTVTTADTAAEVSGAGIGYAITGISGTFNGQIISGLVGTGGAEQTDSFGLPFNNTIFTTALQGFQGSTDGIDNSGIEFTTQNGTTYDIFTSGGAFGYAEGASATVPVPAPTTDESVIVCFAPGTLIRTVLGDVAVEDLVVGDLAVTASGKHRPVRWIGQRAIRCDRHPSPRKVWPYRVAAGALGADVPTRDLWLSPEHALCLDGLLFPVRTLAHRGAIEQVERRDVTYWHVELDSHDILIANGAAAESYLDIGNRHFFAEAGVVALHPDFEPSARTGSCLPYVESGAALSGIRARLFGASPPAAFSGLHLLADGVVLQPHRSGNDATFIVPADAANVRLCSPTIEAAGDVRTLGVLISAVTIDAGAGPRAVPLDDSALSAGFHDVESEGGATWRWTDGDAHLAAKLWRGATGGVLLRLTGLFEPTGAARSEALAA